MADLFIKKGARRPLLKATLLTEDGTPLDLTGATVKLTMSHKRTGQVKLSLVTVTIVTPAAGIVQYAWATGDTDTPGEYDAEFQVTLADTTVLVVPSDGYLAISVLDTLN